MGELLADMTWPQVGAIVAAMSGALAFLGWVWRRFLPFLRRVGHFLDDWFGEPARPGVAARPGVPEQLAALQAEQNRVSKELQTNSGSTVKDAVIRIEDSQKRHDTILAIVVQALLASMTAAQRAEIAKAQERTESHKEAAAMWSAVQAAHESEPPKE